jgi:AraC-like DNA-binding protein
MTRDLDDRRGVLHTPRNGSWALDRREPCPAVAPYVVWYWMVRWDLRGHSAHRQVTLPHACGHLYVEDGQVWLHGPPRTRDERLLDGCGRAAGARFTPSGLAALLGRPLTGGPVQASVLLGPAAADLAAAVTEATVLDTAAAAFDQALTAVLPAQVDPAGALVDRAVHLVEHDRSILRVSDLAHRAGVRVRTLQRLFADHVGTGPSQVIRRCRLQEAALRATRAERVDWAQLAVDLGYYDQAHLVRDFTATIGQPPARYARA